MSGEQLAFVASHLPEPNGLVGRKPYTNLALLPGILKVLRSGCAWKDLSLPDYPDGSTYWRRFKLWRRDAHFRSLWELILRLLRQQKALQLDTLSLDGSLVQSFAFKEKTGYSGKHHLTGVKLSVLSGKNGIPLGVCVAKGNTHDLALARETMIGIRIARGLHKNSMLLADRGYDSLTFREFVATYSVHANIPKRKNVRVREKHTCLYIYFPNLGKGRYVIERTNAWLKNFRRLRHRYDYKAAMFEAFVYLAIIVICVRRLSF